MTCEINQLKWTCEINHVDTNVWKPCTCDCCNQTRDSCCRINAGSDQDNPARSISYFSQAQVRRLSSKARVQFLMDFLKHSFHTQTLIVNKWVDRRYIWNIQYHTSCVYWFTVEIWSISTTDVETHNTSQKQRTRLRAKRFTSPNQHKEDRKTPEETTKPQGEGEQPRYRNDRHLAANITKTREMEEWYPSSCVMSVSDVITSVTLCYSPMFTRHNYQCYFVFLFYKSCFAIPVYLLSPSWCHTHTNWKIRSDCYILHCCCLGHTDLSAWTPTYRLTLSYHI